MGRLRAAAEGSFEGGAVLIYTIKAIPTIYNHVQFRSRLEARWAAFFDLCGWDWDYEPFDLEGWAPDFMLKGKIKALVEVKPIDFRGDDEVLFRQARANAEKAFTTAGEYIPEYPHGVSGDEFDIYLNKHDATPEYEILIVGNGPFKRHSSWGLGVFALESWRNGDDVAELHHARSGKVDYAAHWNDFRFRISGRHDGDHHLRPIRDDTPERLWREAGNVVQWKSPQQQPADYHSQLRRIFRRAA
ncbi:hypothetical protein EVB67_059 [Rhizobium phage RHph_TM3_3_14B]|nr:hypothetical protein EVB67_059 [Rhizobium phage RHph_TM3_3_14B]